MEYSGGMKLLDMMPTGYNLEYVHTLFQALGEKGRNLYLSRQLPIDMIYPGLFGVCYCLLLAYLLKKLNWIKRAYLYLCMVPVFAGLCDYMENFGIIQLLNQFPEISTTLVQYTNLFSLGKSISTTVFFVILLITLVIFGAKSLRKTSN